ncbi:protein-disulfide reductase DsbD [Acidisphaera sp. L21]|uniref:protein-disulfide reductase DsbD family protein n=1 Tax=Acidisphaera sp. L21 TaxID=1641851 RepID=UPI0020B123BA|nr:protein-disulfide reductase DsbD domain-containing protein [Acidisphaera sp. L21]
MKKFGARLAAAGLLALGIPAAGHALESAPVTSSRAVATLVTNTDAIQAGGQFKAALRLQLAPGWHTYWQNPGDAGVAADLTFDLPPGAKVSPIEWPVPIRVAEGPLTTFAYTGDLLLPVTFTAASAPVTLTAHATWLVCRDICVPEQGDFKLALPAGTLSPSAEAPLFTAAAARTPVSPTFHATVSTDGGILRLSGPGLPQGVTSAQFFPGGDGQTEGVGSQTPIARDQDLLLHLALGTTFDPHAPLTGVVILTTGSGVTKPFAISAAQGSIPAATPPQPLMFLLLAALGGGLLLNLMPCVFPVLAMKAMALARLSAADRRTVRLEAGSYTVGVVAAFAALGAVLIALRGAGQAVGWGFQFQSPLFVTLVAWVLCATGLNMSGVFSIGEGVTGTGQALAARRGHAGSFFTGLLAVVVATPCTASFMGAALAGALAAPPATALLVFAVMGLGLALPYASMAAAPRLAGLLPRPGRWMTTLRQALAFPMYGAAVWLVWVVSQQTGPTGVLIAGAGLVGVGFTAWMLGTAQSSSGRSRPVAYGVASAAGLATLALLTIGTTPGPETSEPFTPARLAQLQGEGRPVFVNMTAAWCLSCLVNERIALSPTAVRAAFDHAKVAYLKGDWTKQDPTISNFLREHDRDGVPLYVFYPPGRDPVVLPQILSEGDVLQQVAKLGS